MTLTQHMENYGTYRASQTEAMHSKPNQKLYKITFGRIFEDTKLVLAASKADARKLSRVSNISKIELVTN